MAEIRVKQEHRHSLAETLLANIKSEIEHTRQTCFFVRKIRAGICLPILSPEFQSFRL